MNKKCKGNLGLKRENGDRFTISEKHKIIQTYLTSEFNKSEIYEKFTGKKNHGEIIKWMRDLGYNDKEKKKVFTFVPMNNNYKKNSPGEDSFENIRLKKRIAELEALLKEAEMKALAFSTMVDIAEREFKIPIRKKFNTKP
jgi:transposase